MQLATVVPGGEAAVEQFLLEHADTSMFLRSNLRRAGLLDGGATYEATWFGAVDPAGHLVGVAAHAWNGMILVQADVGLGAAVRAAVPSRACNAVRAFASCADSDAAPASLEDNNSFGSLAAAPKPRPSRNKFTPTIPTPEA